MVRPRGKGWDHVQEIIDLYLAGELSQVKIAEQFGISQAVVSRILRDNGIAPIRLSGNLRGAEHGNWKGGRNVTDQGYIQVIPYPEDLPYVRVMATGYVLEHRLVMGKKLGRPLTDNETVHHIDGDRRNNDPENLQLRQGRHGKGVRYVCADCGSHNVVPTDF